MFIHRFMVMDVLPGRMLFLCWIRSRNGWVKSPIDFSALNYRNNVKIFLVGSDKIFAIENFYVRHLRSLGVNTFHFSAQSIFYDFYHKNIINKLVFRTGLSEIYSTINKKFKTIVNREKPDIIWIFKGMEISPDSLLWARQLGIKLVNYNPDNPFMFSGAGS